MLPLNLLRERKAIIVARRPNGCNKPACSRIDWTVAFPWEQLLLNSMPFLIGVLFPEVVFLLIVMKLG
jgi:hypothetical protein